ncbi:hypothetical protein KFZ76_20140 [Methylovulum psychrotolerans]|uniref:hypothetical protein n=1 Tax=Methylovulum psychrotolerans TaxID=1704499 RepID=UPI001BFF6782|nr:hypothetical protein [Methylovulum psychrotolerans]MBT9100015.1 hypothetical protein [Methylovulum psychrotolerans]
MAQKKCFVGRAGSFVRQCRFGNPHRTTKSQHLKAGIVKLAAWPKTVGRAGGFAR